MDIIFETAVIGYLTVLDAFSGVNERHQYLYEDTLDYLSHINDAVERTVMRLCKEVLSKGGRGGFRPGSG